MTNVTGLLVSLGVFLALLVGGMAVPFAIAIPGLLYLVLQSGPTALNAIGLVTWGSLDSFTLTAIPLFILMAEMLEHSGLGFRAYRGLGRFVSRLPGGLLQTNIIGCAMFAAVSGSSVATAATIGGVALPELRRRGYDETVATGSLAAGGTLGVLFPPSLLLIVYASFTETSVPKLFAAGVMPGLLLTAMFMAYLGIRACVDKGMTGRSPEKTVGLVRALIDLAPFGILILLTFGSIYGGVATPTEAAASACVLGFILSTTLGGLRWAGLVGCMRRTVQITGNVMFIILAAYIYAYAISIGRVGDELTAWLVGLHLSLHQFYLALFVLYTVLGALVEAVGMVVITVPLLLPALQQYHIDLVWFGIVLVVYIEAALITPPIGINLFVIQSVSKGSFQDVVRGTIPFHLIIFLLLLLLTLFPQIALWLPSRL